MFLGVGFGKSKVSDVSVWYHSFIVNNADHFKLDPTPIINIKMFDQLLVWWMDILMHPLTITVFSELWKI